MSPTLSNSGQYVIDAYDITIVLGNIMENAIEACGKIPENENREIELYIEYNKGILFIKAINTYSGTLPEKCGRILTDKKDRQNHGFGIENIKNTVAGYGGSFELYTKGNKFYAEIRM